MCVSFWGDPWEERELQFSKSYYSRTDVLVQSQKSNPAQVMADHILLETQNFRDICCSE